MPAGAALPAVDAIAAAAAAAAALLPTEVFRSAVEAQMKRKSSRRAVAGDETDRSLWLSAVPWWQPLEPWLALADILTVREEKEGIKKSKAAHKRQNPYQIKVAANDQEPDQPPRRIRILQSAANGLDLMTAALRSP